MPYYEYYCPENHLIQEYHSMGEAPATAICIEHGNNCNRHFSLGSATVLTDDEFRKAYLSSAYDKACAERGWRDEYAPRDKNEAKTIQEKTGRVYFGNNPPSNLNMTPEMKSKWDKHGRF